jgi:magnesium transporter
VDRALEAVERVCFTFGDNLKRFFVIVAADFAACHGSSPLRNVFVGTARQTLYRSLCKFYAAVFAMMARVVIQSAAMTNLMKKWRRLKPRVRRHSPGAKPGTFLIEPGAHPTSLRVMAYDEDRVVEHDVNDPVELKEFVAKWPVVWVDVVGLGSEDKLRTIAEIFQMHPLVLEDVVHVHQRAKVDPYENGLFIVVRIPDESHEHVCEQFSLFLGKNFLVTFQERPGDSLDLVRSGLRLKESAARQNLHPDYLAYRLIDAEVDAYFPLIETMGDHLDKLDDPQAITHTREAFSALHIVRRELLVLRRAVWPLRDAISSLRSDITPFITDETRIYLRDCYDHVVQLIDLLESYRDIAGDVRDYYLSTISNRMNEIMKTLTVIATIFLPLSFIAGVYGMNFNTAVSKWNMPELNWRYGYLYSLGLMLVVAAGMLWWFKWRGWLSGFGEERPPADDEKPL